MAEIGIAAIRQRLRPLQRSSRASACALFLFRFLGWCACVAVVLLAQHPALKLAAGLGAGVFSGLLFLIGHDACHGSFTGGGRLDSVIGRLALLTSWHPYSLWEFGHNRVHHSFTNLASRDFVWTPLSRSDYERLSPLGRLLQRAYRSRYGLGFGLYYMIEIWWKWMVWPSPRILDRPRLVYRLDRLSVAALLVALAAAPPLLSLWRGSGLEPGRWALELACLSLLPMLYFSWVIGFVVYFNHTHPRIPWFARIGEWNYRRGQIEATVALRFPNWSRPLMSRIMDHPAHHVQPLIPLSRLEDAEAALEALVPGEILVQPWSLAAYLETLRCCKLYDFERHCWTDFDGRATTGRLLPEPSKTPATMPALPRPAGEAVRSAGC